MNPVNSATFVCTEGCNTCGIDPNSCESCDDNWVHVAVDNLCYRVPDSSSCSWSDYTKGISATMTCNWVFPIEFSSGTTLELTFSENFSAITNDSTSVSSSTPTMTKSSVVDSGTNKVVTLAFSDVSLSGDQITLALVMNNPTSTSITSTDILSQFKILGGLKSSVN